jgi:hypothetical protein
MYYYAIIKHIRRHCGYLYKSQKKNHVTSSHKGGINTMAEIRSQLGLCCWLIGSLLLLSACNGEKDKGKKVVNYFGTFGATPHIDQFLGSVAKELPVIKANSKQKTLESPGHIIQCNNKGCLDPMAATKKLIPYSSPSFAADFEKQLYAFLTKDGQEYCGIEFLAFAGQVKRERVLPILEVLKKFHCEAIIVGRQLRQLPPWPKLDKKSASKFADVLKLSDSGKQAAAKKVLASFGKRCDPVEQFVKETRKVDSNKRREMLSTILEDQKATIGLENCKRSSAQIITQLRIHVAGFDDALPDLYMKKVSFVESPKDADVVFSPKLDEWESFAAEVYKSSKEPLKVAWESATAVSSSQKSAVPVKKKKKKKK